MLPTRLARFKHRSWHKVKEHPILPDTTCVAEGTWEIKVSHANKPNISIHVFPYFLAIQIWALQKSHENKQNPKSPHLQTNCVLCSVSVAFPFFSHSTYLSSTEVYCVLGLPPQKKPRTRKGSVLGYQDCPQQLQPHTTYALPSRFVPMPLPLRTLSLLQTMLQISLVTQTHTLQNCSRHFEFYKSVGIFKNIGEAK